MAAYVEVVSASTIRKRLDRVAWVVFAVVVVPTALFLLAIVALGLPSALMLILPAFVVGALVLRSPVLGLYLLFGATLVIPANPFPAPDSITDNLPFFTNLNLGISLAEILMLVILVGLVAKLASARAHQSTGRLMTPYLIFVGAIVMGEINGLVHGGDFKLSLWELRPQVYGLVVFLVATLLLKDRSQLKVLLAILLVSEAFRAGVGVVRYFFTLDRSSGIYESVLPHEDSYLIGLFLIAVAIGFIWFRDRLLLLMVVITPLVFMAIVFNRRRAGLPEVGLGIVTVMIAAYIVEPRIRRALVVATVLIAFAGAAFTATFWHQQSGTIAEIIRPIKSRIEPSDRDQSSDLYRLAETANLKFTYRTSPVLGIGFGHPFYIVWQTADVSGNDPLYNIIPHNSILWVPMRMGLVGLVTFFGLISMAIIEAIWVMRNIRDKFVRAAVIFALAAVFGELLNGYVDIGLENYRNVIVLGLLLAVINRGAYLAGDPSPQKDAALVSPSEARGRPARAPATG